MNRILWVLMEMSVKASQEKETSFGIRCLLDWTGQKTITRYLQQVLWVDGQDWETSHIRVMSIEVPALQICWIPKHQLQQPTCQVFHCFPSRPSPQWRLQCSNEEAIPMLTASQPSSKDLQSNSWVEVPTQPNRPIGKSWISHWPQHTSTNPPTKHPFGGRWDDTSQHFN